MEALRTWIEANTDSVTITLPPSLRRRRIEVVVLAEDDEPEGADLVAWEGWVASGPQGPLVSGDAFSE